MKNKVVYGSYTFQDDDFKSGGMFLAASLLSSQLQVNSFNAVVTCADPAILDFERNSKLTYFYDDRQRGIFYVQTIKRAGPDLYEISATSTLGLLTEGRHMGGIYTGQTAQEVIADICGTVPFTVKSNLKEIKLYGWLPIAPPRDNLSQVLFAIGAALKTDLDGVLRIEGLWDGISGTVPESKMYQGANVDYAGKITQVIVNEHQYVPWTEVKQLFEGTAQEGDIITFDEPMHSLTADGFTILSSGANWAKVSAGSGVLSGKTYLHNTRQISKDVWPAQEPNVKTVKDATLVSLVNSQACAQRMADYYKCRERINAPVVYHGEIPGDRLATYHPFDKTATDSCLESTDITLSNTLKAQEKSLVGYVPPQIEQTVNYDNRELLTESGTWTVPDGVTSVRVVVIGGGKDGEDGKPGGSSISGSIRRSNVSSITATSSQAGKGGSGGSGGKGGDVFDSIMEVQPGQTIQYTIGEANSATTFGEITSDSGGPIPTGWTDIVTGETFATPGIDGGRGGDGGSPGSYGESIYGYSGGAPKYGSGSFNLTLNYPSQGGGPVKNVGTFSGQSGGGGASNIGNGYSGGAPGGGAYGRSYSDGSYAVTDLRINEPDGGKGRNGGNGEDATFYGCGGNGGYGGGGAGGQGPCTATLNGGKKASKAQSGGSWADGGSGGSGGSGAPGCIILYYGVQKKLQTGQLVDKNNKLILDRLGRRIIV